MGNDEELVSRGLEVVLGESDRLSNLVEELLDFSRMQNGGMNLKIEKMDILAELDETVVKMRDEYEQLPADGRPSLWRFAYSHMSQLLALEKRCDADVQSVVEEIRTLQRGSGLSEKTADLVQSAYNDEKIFAIAYYIDMLRGQ